MHTYTYMYKTLVHLPRKILQSNIYPREYSRGISRRAAKQFAPNVGTNPSFLLVSSGRKGRLTSVSYFTISDPIVDSVKRAGKEFPLGKRGKTSYFFLTLREWRGRGEGESSFDGLISVRFLIVSIPIGTSPIKNCIRRWLADFSLVPFLSQLQRSTREISFRHLKTIARSLFQIISYDSNRGGVSVVTEKGDSTTSFLLVQEAKPSDSGRYTCNPSNAQPKSITVHVLNGEWSKMRRRFLARKRSEETLRVYILKTCCLKNVCMRNSEQIWCCNNNINFLLRNFN